MAQIKQTQLSPGGKYTVQVRAKSKLGGQDNVSEWSNVFKFTTSNDTVSPKPPSNIVAVSRAANFIMTWTAPTQNEDNSACTDLNGYWIRFRNADNTSQVTRETFVEGPAFELTFALNKEMFGAARGNLIVEVRSVDQMGNRSTTWATATVTNPRPANVTGLVATSGLETIILNWDKNTTDDDLIGYEVHVSTASADFTPTAGTRRYSGPGTSYVLPTGNPVPHYFKVRALDIFELFSVADATAVATPRTTTSTDGTPPGPATNVGVTSTSDGTTAAMKVVWTAPTDLDVDRYVVRYARNTSDWSYVDVPSDRTDVTISNLRSDTPYYVAVQVWDFASNKSAWVNASTYPFTTAKDTTAPNKPATPTISTSATRVLVSHNMKDSAGVNLPADMSRIEVHAGTASNFTVNSSTKVTELDYYGPGVAVNSSITYINSTDTWWKIVAVDTSGNASVPSDAVQGNPGLITGAFIENATITDANIQNLSAAKLVAGTAFVNDLFIRSGLTIDNANGKIQSDDYNAANQLGWKLDRDGLYLYEGTVAAKSLLIQDSQNIIPPQFADFEFADRYYFTATNNGNPDNVLNNANVKIYKDSAFKFGSQSLRVVDLVGGASGNYIFLSKTGLPANIVVEPGETYIISFYVKNNLSTATTLTIAPRNINIGAYNIVAQPGTTFVRYSYLFTVPANTTGISFVVGTSVPNQPFDFSLDGFQMERQIGKLDTPSPWTPPGATTINGESITTGSIRSSAPAEGIADQPAWSLNTTGGLQVGDALVRGSLTVGAGTDTTNSRVKSSDYVAGTSGWAIKGDGDVEFNTGTFRGDLNIARTTSGLMTNLKASINQQKTYLIDSGSPLSTGSVSTINTPAISGQHYAYARTYDSGLAKWVPTVPDPNLQFKYYIGPSTERSLVLQTNSSGADYLINSPIDTQPWNTRVTTLKLGEVLQYDVPPSPKEQSGWQMSSANIERTGVGDGKILYTYTKDNLGVVNFESNSYALATEYGFTTPRSSFAPEYTEIANGTKNPLLDNRAAMGMSAAAGTTTLQKNLLKAPYDESYAAALTFDNSLSYNDAVGTGAGQVTVSGAQIGVTQTVETGMYDTNYKTPTYQVNFSVGSTATAGILWFTNKRSTSALTSNTNYQVDSLRRGRTYIVSIFIRTDPAGSQTSGTQGPPITDFNVIMGLEVQNGNSSQSTYIAAASATATTVTSKSVLVKGNVHTQRISAAITIPNSPTTETTNGNLYIAFPAYTPRNRAVFITHPMVEERIWGNHADPNVAASLLPTAWVGNVYTVRSESTVKAYLTATTTNDFRLDAYNRHARGNQLYGNLNQYQVSDYGVYRNAPRFEISIDRSQKATNLSGGYVGDSGSAKYAFSEAGLQFPSSYEPYMPAGLQAFYNNLTLPAGGGTGDKTIELTNNTQLKTDPGIVTMSGDIRTYNNTQSLVVDKAGFYLMTAVCVIQNAGPDAMWFDWRVTNVNGNFSIGRTAVGRANVWEQTSTLLRYLNRDDIISSLLISASANSASHLVTDIMVCLARIN